MHKSNSRIERRSLILPARAIVAHSLPNLNDKTACELARLHHQQPLLPTLFFLSQSRNRVVAAVHWSTCSLLVQRF